ncbi:hypothetical protein PACTADRAFT_47643 [Pachysolen tannophilus NRRL Y-2460]|uniref:Spindle pole body component n=1 Tax=Pachysolen tannophilus NRRL Y-2460 TaxID=669874 RepID=A0A1E4U1C8_PACTA|nr:hypothetical protein PACTADRAFT_47643 [Pachysolen tannophilus NRRL Y-2460]
MSMHSGQMIRVYFHKLISSLLPDEIDHYYADGLFENLYNFLILGDVDSTNSTSLQNIINEYKKVVLYQANSSSNWKIFQTVVENLISFNYDEEKILNYLIFLDDFKNNRNEEQEIRRPTTRYNSMPAINGNGNHINNNNMNNGFRANSFTLGSKTLNELIQPYYYNNHSDQNNITDEEILKYLSFTLLGSTSNIFPFINNGEGIKLPLNTNYSISGLLFKILEPALLYRKLIAIIENNNKHQNYSKSQIKVAFFTELQNNYLKNYAKLINDLFSAENHLTIKIVYLSIYDEIIKLRFLHYLTMNAELPSNEFLSLLFKFSDHGDALIQKVAKNLFDKSVAPYYEVLFKWITSGELNRFFVELKADHQQQQQQILTIAHQNEGIINAHKFIKHRVPEFIPLQACQKIYQIGKTIIFLKNYCKELKFLNDFSQKNDFLIKNFKEMNLVQKKLTNLINLQHKEIINYFNFVIVKKFGLLEILQNLNNFLLMSKGDFINSIIEKSSHVLNKPSNSLTSHQLTRILQDSIYDSTVKNFPKSTLNSLDARVLEIGGNSSTSSWDVFTLDYRINMPLSIILNNKDNESLKEYLRMFNFLFKLKRVQYLLHSNFNKKKTFREVNTYVKKLKLIKKNNKENFIIGEDDVKFAMVVNKFKKLNIINLNMLHFMNKITNFFNYEVIDKNFHKFIDLFSIKDEDNYQINSITENERNLKVLKQKLMPNKEFLSQINSQKDDDLPQPNIIKLEYNEFDIDELIENHKSYILSISRNKILNNKNLNSKGKVSNVFYIQQLNNLVHLIFKFVILFEEFYNNSLELLTVLNNKAFSNQSFEHEKAETDEYITMIGSKLGVLENNLYKDVLINFKGGLDFFVKDLISDDDLDLKYLGAMLDD